MTEATRTADPVVIGSATLYLADCVAVLDQIPEVDLLLTDPPYGIGFAAQPTDYQRAAGMKPREWDNAPVDGLDAIRAKGRQQIIWGGNYYDLPPGRGWISWFKPDAPPSMGHFELAWTNLDRNTMQLSQSIAATNAERCGHPTQKPLRLMKWCLAHVPEAKTVLDPFMGSGTTGVACIEMGLEFFGVEREPQYFAMAVERIRAAHSQQRLFA